ncbi:MAG TPA: sulfatase-like hydrolase/transferase [Holophagaceae bacterium]|nr:sulfatase-like hydrolase/transferase [Holophagaceae bacterium]
MAAEPQVHRPWARLAVFTLALHLGGLAFVGPRPHGAQWLALAVGPLVAWGLLRPLLHRMGPRMLGLCFALWGAWMAFCLGHRLFLGTYPDHGTLEFAFSEPSYAWTLVKDRLRLGTFAFLGSGALLGWVASRGLGPERRATVRFRWPGILLAVAGLAVMDARGYALVGLSPDASTLLMLGQTRARRIGAGGLRRALGRQVPPAGPTPPFSVLVLVHESLGPLALDAEVAPFLHGALERGELLAFPRAYAAASMTDVALPSLLSGANPLQGSQLYHRTPLLWHRAQAAGYPTAFFTAQRMNYYGFPDYLLADGLDAWESADHAGLPLVNDTGTDDAWLEGQLAGWLAKQGERPTFTVLQFNATHAPGLERPEHKAWTAARVAARWPEVHALRREPLARYLNACAYLDALQARLFQLLATRGLLDRTWIIATADHGEAWEGPPRGRLDDVRAAALQVPLWMRLPKGFPEAWRTQLEANRTRLVGNQDLAPTLAEAFGQRPAVFPGTLGQSLLSPLGPDRTLLSHNSGEIRRRDPEALSVLMEEGEGLYQLRWHTVEGLQAARPAGLWETRVEPDAGHKLRARKALEDLGPGTPARSLSRHLLD